MMTVFDVVVNTDDLVVLGPPDVIDVAVSIGEQGQRGATFYAGSGDPNNAVVAENIFGNEIAPIAGDIFINTATGPEYGWLYIYNPKIVGDQWDQVLQVSPSIFAKRHSAIFSSGTHTISIPVADILPPNTTENNTDKYIVSVTGIGGDPYAFAINSKSIASSNLNIVVEGIKYSSGSWSALNETINIDLIITVV